jgi:hypothetical protein
MLAIVDDVDVMSLVLWRINLITESKTSIRLEAMKRPDNRLSQELATSTRE